MRCAFQYMKELVEYARNNPRMKYGLHTKAGIEYAPMITINREENVTFVEVPYESDGTMVPAILDGHTPDGITGYAPIKTLGDTMKVKILLTKQRTATSFRTVLQDGRRKICEG